MSLKSIQSDWKELSIQDPINLSPAIDQIHRGVQYIAMAGKHFVKNLADDSHTNLKWLAVEEVLAGNWIRDKKGNFRFAMRPKDLTMIAFNSQMEMTSKFGLDGKTNNEALEWMKSQLKLAGKDPSKMIMDIHYDIPSHETDKGAPYKLEKPVLFKEIAKYRSNSDLILRHFTAQYKSASDVRTWPHHFDIGSYIPMEFDKNGNATKSFSIGLGIPDSASNEPYFYVTTWSVNADNTYANLPALPSGEWLTTPFNGAVLRASEIVKQNNAEAQAALVYNFLDKSIAYSKALLHI